jgi:transposase
MFALNQNNEYFLYKKSTDMRKGFDGLCGLVQNQLNENPINGKVYIFINKNRNRLKILHWESGGFVLYYKRLEKGTLKLPDFDKEKPGKPISWSDLVLITQGISIIQTRQQKRYL